MRIASVAGDRMRKERTCLKTCEGVAWRIAPPFSPKELFGRRCPDRGKNFA